MSAIAKIEQPNVPASQTPMDLLHQAVANGNIELAEKLMGLQERWEKNQARKTFEIAMAAAKAEIPVIKKNKHVGFDSKRTDSRTDYYHEDLGEIARTVDPVLAKHGLNYRYRSRQEGGRLQVTCVIAHRDGHFEETTLEAGNDTTGNKNSHQGVGSAATYLQRYTLKLALGLAASKDDDGKTAEAEEPVNEEQLKKILTRMREVGVNAESYCKVMKVERVDDTLAKDFATALRHMDDVEKYARKGAAK